MSAQERRTDRKQPPHAKSDLEFRVEAIEAQVKALVDLFKAVAPDVEIAAPDPYSAAFVRFRERAKGGVLR